VTGILTISRKVKRGEAVPEPQGFLDFLAVAGQVEETHHHYSGGLEDFPTVFWIFRGYFVIFDLCNVLFDLF